MATTTTRKTLTLYFEDGECEEIDIRLPADFVVCPDCDGTGTHVHPALSVWGNEEIAEDPEGYEDMMRGRYDVRCSVCDGNRVVPEIAYLELDAETAHLVYLIEEQEIENARDRADDLAVRRAESGYAW